MEEFKKIPTEELLKQYKAGVKEVARVARMRGELAMRGEIAVAEAKLAELKSRHSGEGEAK